MINGLRLKSVERFRKNQTKYKGAKGSIKTRKRLFNTNLNVAVILLSFY